MCRRYSFSMSPDKAAEALDARVANLIDWQPKHNAVPGNYMPVITNEFPGVIQFFRWGLTPQWATDDKMGLGMYNTTVEKIKEKPAYEKIYKYKRCIVLADEWYYLPKGKKETGDALSIHLPGKTLMCFAGLWDVWGDGLNSFSIITHPAHEEYANLFPEMPFLLNAGQMNIWLAKGVAGAAQNIMLYSPAKMELEWEKVDGA